MSTTTLQTYFEPMKFIPPTLEQVKARAKEIDLPEHEAKKFFLYFESNGWRVGRTKMQRWAAALSGWKLRWEERQPNNAASTANGNTVLTGAQVLLFSKEYERLQTKLEDLDYNGKSYGWTPKLKDERLVLIRRKGELKKLLGITV